MKNLKVRYLEESGFSAWDEFVDSSKQGNIFNKSYWLKSVSDDFKILVCEENNKIIGGIALPAVKGKYYRNPKLTPNLGVLLPKWPDKTKYSTRISNEIEIVTSLIDNIPNFKQFDYNFNYNFTNYLPFIWNDFNIGVRYTYVLEDLSNLDVIYSNFQYDVRYTINKALKTGIKVNSDYSIKEFYEINKKTFDRQGIEIPYTMEFFENLDKTLVEQNARKMLFAVNEKEEIVAGVYLIYDDNCTYYLMGGTDPQYRNTGVQSLLIWESIKFASQVSKKFDFEGSTIKSIEKYFRDFGGEQKIIYNVYKSDVLTEMLYKVARKNKKLVKKILKV